MILGDCIYDETPGWLHPDFPMGNEPLLADADDNVNPAPTIRRFGFDTIRRDKPAWIIDTGSIPTKAITGLDVGLHQLIKIGGPSSGIQGLY